ncbi:MAG: trypsin-like peptidase domain-containing protein [Legionella sp.]|uniref:S1C family serine protease n=1 Tax=Legionella sp. TaxID=459 RepID=UPI00283ED7ED|nr:trypsin-like peptidase domain-containing protein [Legionella sp.]
MPKDKFGAVQQPPINSQEETTKKKQRKEPHNNATPPPSDSQSPDFTATDFASLSENEHGRYPPNSKKIGHAVIVEQAGQTIALQYELPSPTKDRAPTVRPLEDIEAIEPFHGMHRYRAHTPQGTQMYAKRIHPGIVGDQGNENSIQIACFSPEPQVGKPPFWGSTRQTPLFRPDLSKTVRKDLDKEVKEIKPVTKGGDTLMVEHASVPQRDQFKTRNPDQNTVMGESARDAYENFFNNMVDELHPEMKERLKRAFTADLKDAFYKNSYRPEWLHAKGWSLMPMNTDPQTKDNLGAGPKWANTQMMILERIIKWFALHAPESLLSIKPKFDMLLDSELIKHIDFKVKIQIKERFVELAQSIDPFQAYPMFPKASDLAQGTGITHSILHHRAPTSEQVVKNAPRMATRSRPQTVEQASSSSSILTRTRIDEPSSSTPKTAPKPAATTRKRAHSSDTEDELISAPQAKRPKMRPESSDPQHKIPLLSASKGNHKKRKHEEEVTEEEAAATLITKKPKYPTKHKHDKSVTQIFTEFFVPDYDNPWLGPKSASCSGSGFIVERSGKKYILTNAHVAENATYMQLRLGNSHKKYEAKIVGRLPGYQCDLALLSVDDPEFQASIVPVEFGEMVKLQQKVTVIGYPMGGTELSISKGIVSRIQVDGYSMSDQRLLQAQIDAAVNPGNSGGPVFSDGKVVGVAFQGYGGHQGLSYIIPVPIIEHFLDEILSNKEYRGFPTIPMITEELENANERAYYRMAKRTGVRITNIDNLSDAYGKLKRDDILLAIDGLPVSNEGTVDIPGIGNCIDFCHVTQSKFIGDTVTLRVLRKNPLNNRTEEIDIEVVLDTILGDTEKVSVEEHDKMPTYYINSGICFVPLTRNYMNGDGFAFEDIHLVEENCSLPDAPKKNPNEQIIVINTILKCNETQGYEKHIQAIVKEINGKPINNIHDVLLAMEQHQGEQHIITLGSKSKIVIPNMSVQEHARLLKRHHISQDRSVDLVTAQDLSASAEEELQSDNSLRSPVPQKFFPHGLLGKSGKKPTDLRTPSRRIIAESSSDESEESDEDNLFSDGMTQGMRSYMQKIQAMSERYKDAPDLDEEDMDSEEFEANSDELSESSDQSSQSATYEASNEDTESITQEDEIESDEEEMSIEEVKPPRRAPTAPRRHVFFQSASMDVDQPPAKTSHNSFSR